MKVFVADRARSGRGRLCRDPHRRSGFTNGVAYNPARRTPRNSPFGIIAGLLAAAYLVAGAGKLIQ